MKMRYLLSTLLLALLTLSAITAMADEEVETSVVTLAGEAYLCDLTGPDDGDIFGSGCFVFADTLDEDGQATAVLTVGSIESYWTCTSGASDPEEVVLCDGNSDNPYYTFTGYGAGELTLNPAAGEPDLLLNTAGITGPTIGTVGVARCYVNPACQPAAE